MKGTVYLVGAGPGDPKLITLRGLELLQTADVIVYDRLAHPSLLNHARTDAEKIFVGKESAHHVVKQPDINRILVGRALAGKNVVRLKGGDPFVFGRGGEEAEICHDAGILFEIIPGITSAIAAGAYAGIPVTHRDASSSFAVITGHERDDSRESGTREPGQAEQRRNWAHIAYAADTLVFLMGVENLHEITSQLQKYGRDSDTPVALVQWGTWPKQRVVVGTLATIVSDIHNAKLTSPAVCIVGEVVRLRETLRWFDDPAARPLFGKRVLVTRTREQASTLSDLLRSRGADPVEFPLIKIQRLDDYSSLDSELSLLNAYDWVVFTSTNAVDIAAERMDKLQFDSRTFSSCKIAVIGPATAAALWNRCRIIADYVPEEAVAESVIENWPDQNLNGKRILIPRAAEARELLPDALRKMGAEVNVQHAYETIIDNSNTENLLDLLRTHQLDVLTFSSSSTVKNFVEALGITDNQELSELLSGCIFAAIGPITADTMRSYNFPVHIMAEEHTIPGLVSALERYPYVK